MVLAESRVEVPLERSRWGFVVGVVLDGAESRRFLVDTGVSVFVLSPFTAESLGVGGLPILRRVTGPEGSVWRFVPGGEIDVVELGGGAARFEEMDYWVLELPGDHEGILGLGLFSHGLVTFDLPNSRLILERGELPEPDGRTVFPYRLVAGVPAIEVSVAGRPLEVEIDSGFAGSLCVDPQFARDLPWTDHPPEKVATSSVIGSFTNELRRLDGVVTLGIYEAHDVSVIIGEGVALLGDGFLRHFAITVDQANRRVRFVR